MNARIGHIAVNTFREAVRDRVLYNLIAFALLISAAAIFVGQISLSDALKQLQGIQDQLPPLPQQ